ncbi:Serine/arginine-rich splicing factor RS41 [Ananas comosus]|uniref:Serine/arginine-rich splicing factor RS41 n=1 Tax=Ananas comosus TaxID=4615 RepID=A0A199VS22_ANACO|nr:Serine/arginine-rich splicing factor RS41 [Ananas comosus]
MRSIFCGNFEYDARQSDLERLFGKYGKVDRVDMKSGKALLPCSEETTSANQLLHLKKFEQSIDLPENHFVESKSY